MIWPFSKTDTDINQAATTLNPFISAALSGLKKQDLLDQGRTRVLAECYVYGAIRYLASYDDMRPASTEFLMESMFVNYFDADSDELNQCLEFCTVLKDGGKEKLFMMEGAGALRRWLVNNDQAVASSLKDLMKMSN